MTDNKILPEKTEDCKSESVSPDNNELVKITYMECQCESRFLYSSPCLLAEIEEDEDFLKK